MALVFIHEWLRLFGDKAYEHRRASFYAGWSQAMRKAINTQHISALICDMNAGKCFHSRLLVSLVWQNERRRRCEVYRLESKHHDAFEGDIGALLPLWRIALTKYIACRRIALSVIFQEIMTHHAFFDINDKYAPEFIYSKLWRNKHIFFWNAAAIAFEIFIHDTCEFEFRKLNIV